MTIDRTILDEFLETTARSAGKILLDRFGHAQIIGTKKNAHDVVTDADLAAQTQIVAAITSAFPNHGIVGEEEDLRVHPEAESVWFIDPLDGTKNFATRVPIFGVSLGLRVGGVMEAGAIYLPITDELCIAHRGHGARFNGRVMHGSTQTEWTYSHGIGPIRSAAPRGIALLQAIDKLSNGTAWVNAVASAVTAAVWMADGRRDWYVTRRSKAWDYAAGSLIMAEAGCTVTDLANQPWQPESTGLVAASPALHAELLTAARETS